jgi:hypothetical protein
MMMYFGAAVVFLHCLCGRCPERMRRLVNSVTMIQMIIIEDGSDASSIPSNHAVACSQSAHDGYLDA